MGAAAAVIAVATVVTVAGQIKARRDQARAEERNAAFLAEQAEFARQAGEREVTLFERESGEVLAGQIGSFAKAGLDFSGSPLLRVTETRRLILEEKEAIRKNARFNVRFANVRAEASRKRARDLKDPLNTLLGSGGTLLTGGSAAAGASR